MASTSHPPPPRGAQTDISLDHDAATVTTVTSLRDKLGNILHNHRFHVAVIVLVVLDVLLVVGEIILDLEILEVGGENEETNKVIPEVLHYCSIAILSLFVVELLCKLYVMRVDFFKSKLEIFDGVVIVVAFVLDIVFAFQGEGARQAVGLLVVLRLWRVTRVINGIILSVKAEAHKKIKKEKVIRILVMENFEKLEHYCTSLESYATHLESLLGPSEEERPVKPEFRSVEEDGEEGRREEVEVDGFNKNTHNRYSRFT